MSQNYQPHEHHLLVMFPTSYNKLRETLVRDFPNLWKQVGGAMVHDTSKFILMMDNVTGSYAQLLGDDVEACCQHWLGKLANMQDKPFWPAHELLGAEA